MRSTLKARLVDIGDCGSRSHRTLRTSAFTLRADAYEARVRAFKRVAFPTVGPASARCRYRAPLKVEADHHGRTSSHR